MKVKVTDKCIGCGSCVAITESKIFDFNDDGLAECVIDKISEELRGVFPFNDYFNWII